MYGYLKSGRDFKAVNCRFDEMEYSNAVAEATKPLPPTVKKKKHTREEVLAAFKQLGLK